MANTNDSTSSQSPRQGSGSNRVDPYNVHPNSLLAKIMQDPELFKKYKAWIRENLEDNLSVEQWAREGFISWGGELYSEDDE